MYTLPRVRGRASRPYGGALSLTRERARGIPENIIPFRFSKEALQTYLAAYREAGCPMVSHSETYRRAYRPAYRVVLQRHSLPCFSQERDFDKVDWYRAIAQKQ